MNIERSRIIVEFRDSNYKELLQGFKNIDIIYESKKKYALIYCNRADEKRILELLSRNAGNAYVSNEKVEGYNF